MTPIERAESRAAQSCNPSLFRSAFYAGRRAEAAEDSDAYVRALIQQGDHAAAAGYLEGLASRRELPATVHLSDCGCERCRMLRERRAYERRLRDRRKQVTA